MVAIGLRKPYAKTKIVESCTCVMYIDCRWLLLMGSKYPEHISKIRITNHD
jgi:hypothetical protein